MKRNTKKYVIIVILNITVSIIILAGFAWAKYISMLSGKVEAPVAHFYFKVTGDSYSEENGVIFAITRKDENLKVAKDMLAPRNIRRI